MGGLKCKYCIYNLINKPFLYDRLYQSPAPTPSPTPEIPSQVLEARDWGITQANLEGILVPMNAIWSAENITP